MHGPGLGPRVIHGSTIKRKDTGKESMFFLMSLTFFLDFFTET